MTTTTDPTPSPILPPPPPPLARPLSYSMPTQAKPALLTAVGVLSIVIGALGVLASLRTIVQAAVLGFVMPRMASVGAPPPPPMTPPRVVATAPASPGPRSNPAATPVPASSSTSDNIAAAPTPAPMSQDVEATPAADDTDPAAPGSQSTVAGATTIAATGATTATAPGAVTLPAFSFSISKFALAAELFDGVAGIALAVFLFVLGILTLRGSPRAARGHVFWAWLKLPAALVGGVGTWLLTRSMFESMNASMATFGGAPPQSPVMTIALVQAVLAAAFGCAYPIAILIVLRTHRVRAYYRAGAGMGGA